jgi:membrane fusion protein, adhesin transport system
MSSGRRIAMPVFSGPEQMPTLRLVRSSRPAQILSKVLVGIFVTLVVSLIFTPWQQTSMGTGRVVAYEAIERQQKVEAPIEGRVIRWHVQEGSRVKMGDVLVELSDNDPELMARLRQEREAVLARMEAARTRARAVESRKDFLRGSQTAAVSAAGNRARMAADRTRAAQQAVEAAEMSFRTAVLNLDRQKALLEKGLTSVRNLELAELDEARTRTELERSRAGLAAARTEEAALRADQTRAETDGDASLQDAAHAHAVAMAEAAAASVELTRLDTRISRQATQQVTAPRDGAILRILVQEGGEMVKMGTPLATFVPSGGIMAVELWVSGNDVPLISEGRHVRLQFEGWPALQFSGWPSVAIGTFGGRVAVVDAADDGKGKFRILVVPDDDEPWPEERFLRQGVRAHGWVLLDQVSLGFELWRQFNGFPPALPSEEAAGKVGWN